jgi:HEAT repeat protein
MSQKPRRNAPFQEVLQDLLDDSRPFPAVYLHRFSDINQRDLNELKKIWPQVSADRRAALMEDLEELSEADTLTYFEDLCLFTLEDEDPRVRANTIRLLWESNNLKLANKFIKMMKQDPDPVVRANAANALGVFIYRGELEEIPETLFKKVEENLLETLNGQDRPLVRRKALEALGFSSRQEVSQHIRSAYNSGKLPWVASAVFAMGRSADDRWKKLVMQSLGNPEDEVRVEAIRAVGELEIHDARQNLLVMLVDPDNEDWPIQSTIIWSLSLIGGDNVKEALQALADQVQDDEEEEFIEGALENLTLTEGFKSFEMFKFDLKEDDEIDKLVDLYEPPEYEDEDPSDE